MSEELKPCPFCGKIEWEVYKACGEWWWRCTACHVSGTGYDRKKDAVAALNTRPSPWIAITPEAMPEEYKVVLVLDSLGTQHGWYEMDEGKWYTDDNCSQSKEILNPTHYMHTPPLP